MASILRRSPGSRLLIHYCAQGLEQPESPAQRALRSELERRGIERDRVQFAGRVGASEHLSVIGGADIALDTFPYNGQTTTCECLLMGVPVISISGDHHVARVGLSLLTRVGAGDLCASDPDEYVELAVALAGDRARLRQLQRELRPRLLASPLVNGRSVVETEDALVEIWRRRVSMWGRTASFGM